MYTPSYISVERLDADKSTTYIFTSNRFVVNTLSVLFVITGAVGFYRTLAGTENPAPMIVSIVSVVAALILAFFRTLTVFLIIDQASGMFEIKKTMLSFAYKKEYMPLSSIDHIQYKKTISYYEGAATHKSHLIIRGDGKEVLLFTGDAALIPFGKDLAAELHTQFVEKKDL